MKKKKFILVLSGGGGKGAFQVGALKYLYDKGIRCANGPIPGKDIHFDYVAGISAGSLNASMIAMDKFAELETLWKDTIAGNPQEIWVSEFIDNNFQPNYKKIFKKLLPKLGLIDKIGLLFKKNQQKLGKQIIEKILSMDSFASNKPLEDKISQLMNVAEVKSEILRVGMVSLKDGQYYSIKHDSLDNESFQKAILASSAMPAIFPAIRSITLKGGEIHQDLVDGGIRNVSPLGDIVKDVNENFCEDTDYYVIIINNHCKELEPLQNKSGRGLNFLNIAYRSLVDIALNEIFKNDVQEFIRINDIIRQVEAADLDFDKTPICLTNMKDGRILRKFYYKIIQPEEPIGNTLDFSAEQINQRMEKGYLAAQRMFEDQIDDCSLNFWDDVSEVIQKVES